MDFIVVVIMLVDFHVYMTSQMNRLVKAICYARLLYPNLHLKDLVHIYLILNPSGPVTVPLFNT